jgi:quinol-cytochrome oxidoreductase complex cytochrome b subunit
VANTSRSQHTFVGAHFVHFSAVLLLAWLDASHELHRLERPMLAVTASGVFHISLIGLTASARPDQRARLRLNRLTFYLAWVFFVLAFGAGAPIRPRPR